MIEDSLVKYIYYANLELVRFCIFFGGILFFLLLELTISYREDSIPKLNRWLTNLGLTVLNCIILKLAFAAVIINCAIYVTEKKLGLFNMVQMPYWLKLFATVIFMDFMHYVMHLLSHQIPLMWRFHRIHHSDLNVDVSTATRYHTGEMIIAAIVKIGLVFFIGADLFGIVLIECVLVITEQFHHSCIRVPLWFEKAYGVLFIPPSMHRIHHSVENEERDSNYGTIFSFWDRFFGTLLTDVDQNRIWVGVNGQLQIKKLRMHRLLEMPLLPITK